MTPKYEYRYTLWLGGGGNSDAFEDEILCRNRSQLDREIRELKEGNWMYGKFRIEWCYIMDNATDKVVEEVSRN